MAEKLRLGILGCARIVENAIIAPSRYIDSMELYAIASRHPENAQLFSQKYGIKIPMHSYRDVLADENVDFVYIALPNDMHAEWAKKAACAKKHVLIEKPLCINVEEIEGLDDICKKNNVFLLEGMMVQHHPWQAEIKRIIDEEIYGKLKKVETDISFLPGYDLSKNYRSDPSKGGGSFYDLSPYWFQFVQNIRDVKIAECEGYSDFNGPNNCDMTFTASMIFPDGLICRLETSFEKPYRASHTLFFEKGILTIKDMFRANTGRFKITAAFEAAGLKTVEKISFGPSCYYENQLIFFIEVINNIRSNIPLEKSVERIKLMSFIYNKALQKK